MSDLHTEWSPFQLTFGRDANMPSLLATTPSLKYPDLVKLWQERDARYIRKARERIEKSKKNYKRMQDVKIVLPRRLFDIGDLVMIENNKENKLSPDWKGPAVIFKVLPNNNYEIIFDNESSVVHADRLKIYNY